MIENLLKTCGLNETEQKVLLNLLRRDSSIASVIAKQTKLKRPTVYAALDTLVNYGLVIKHHKGSVNYFSVVSLDLIPKVLENRAKNQFEDVKQATKLLVPQLSSIAQTSKHELGGFEISALDSSELIHAQLMKIVVEGDFCAIFNPQVALKDGSTFTKDDVLNYLQTTTKTQANIKEILVSGPLTDWYKDQITSPTHIIKEIPADKKILSDMILINGMVLISDYDPKSGVGIKVKEKRFYESMMTVFEILWAQL